MSMYGRVLVNALCWCRSVSTSLVSLCSTNSQTSLLRQAPSPLHVVALQRKTENSQALWISPCFFVLYSLAHSLDRIFLWAGSTDLSVSTQISSNNFLPASLHSCIGTNSIVTFRECTIQPLSSRLAVKTRSSARYPALTPSQNPPPSCKIWSYSRGISGTGPAISSTAFNWSVSLSCSRRACRIVTCSRKRKSASQNSSSLSPKLPSHALQNSSPRLFWFSNCLWGGPLFCTRIHLILKESSEHSICTQVLVRSGWFFCELSHRGFSPRCMSSRMFKQPVTISKMQSHVALHNHMKTFTKWHQFLHVLIWNRRVSLQVLCHKKVDLCLEFRSTTTARARQ